MLGRVVQRLFVYGSLAPGRPNAHVLADVPGIWQPATVGGRLLQEGWGAKLGYPAIVLDESGPRVDGFVFSAESLGEHWQRLDDFEGGEYQRVVTPATLDDGGIIDVHIYVLSNATHPPVADGPFRSPNGVTEDARAFNAGMASNIVANMSYNGP